MKKYLMSGIAAIAIATAFTSCSKSTDLYDQNAVDERNKQEEQKKVDAVNEAYAAAFEKAFGKVGANVDWGFGTKANTRTVNVNGNQWVEIPEVSPAEKTMVFNYVNMTRPEMKAAGHKYTEVFPENITNYWVTQVWTGTDTYNNYDGTSGMGGSSKMNNLQIAETTEGKISAYGDLSEAGWYHVNNFNRGDNTDWSGNTLIYNSGTLDFAYLGSEDANYHNKWIAVNGADIDATLAGYYYICFDHVAIPDGCETIFERPQHQGDKVHVPGAFKTLDDLLNSGLVSINENGEKTITVSEYDWTTNGYKDVTYVIESDWKWTQVVSGNLFIDANDVYTDWIIRLVKANNGTNNYRVIAEDLNATEKSDFDFNDVVFDVIPNGTSNATIKLIAAGGIYKLTVNGYEVHEAFGENATDGKYPMINTGGGPSHPAVNLCTIPGDFSGNDARTKIKDIVIKVYKPGFEDGIELTATTGAPACKILVDDTFGIVPERQDISNEYQKFTKYVGGFVDDFWWKKGVVSNDAE